MGGDRRDRLRSFHEEARERRLFVVELGEEMAGGRQRRTEVLDRHAEVGVRPLVLFGRALEKLLQPLERLRVEGVEQLVEVHDAVRGGRRQRRARRKRGLVVGPRDQRDVAVGDARQRRHPHRGRGAFVQRCQRRVDVDRDQRLVVGGEGDVLDAPDRHAADLHLIALDELVAFGEQDLVGGPAPAGEDQIGDDQHDQRERTHRERPRETPR